jgi:integrase
MVSNFCLGVINTDAFLIERNSARFVSVQMQTIRSQCLKKGKMLFGEFALDVISTLPIRVKTRQNYASMYRCHIEKHLAQHHLDSIKRSEIQDLIKFLPPQTMLMTLAVIKTIFREAVSRDYLDASPAHGVRTPSLVVPARKFLTWDELKASDFGRYTPQIRFLALHGLRWGEAVVLTKDDVRDGRIYVNKSIHGSTKSQSGVRVVPLIGDFCQIPKSPKTLRKVLDPYGIHIHSLRHTYAYLLKTQGIHVTTAQKLLGHSDPKVTLRVYTQVLDNEIENTGEILKRVC